MALGPHELRRRALKCFHRALSYDMMCLTHRKADEYGEEHGRYYLYLHKPGREQRKLIGSIPDANYAVIHMIFTCAVAKYYLLISQMDRDEAILLVDAAMLRGRLDDLTDLAKRETI